MKHFNRTLIKFSGEFWSDVLKYNTQTNGEHEKYNRSNC